jgi:hypothetical protein
MATDATPRITAPYLDSFTNITVRIVGRVEALHGDTATLDAGGPIRLLLNRVCFPPFSLLSIFFLFFLGAHRAIASASEYEYQRAQ